jgi:sulfur-oxidizing protein SoxY
MLFSLSRRDWLFRCLKTSVGAWGLSAVVSRAQDMSVLGRVQDMSDARLRNFDEMIAPYVVRQPVKQGGITLSLPMLADNGHLVPLSLKVDSPMTEESHVTHIYLISQRNPGPLMAMFVLGPWNGRAELTMRVRLSGTQMVVALARLSDGTFRYETQEVVVTEAACIDNG